MGRPVSARVAKIERELRRRIEAGLVPAGSPFLSNRGVARSFGLSYQTAHRILARLAASGHLVRRPGSGSTVAGEARVPQSVVFCFHPRAGEPGTFGNHLLERLRAELHRLGIPSRVDLRAAVEPFPDEGYPVFWSPGGAGEGFPDPGRHCLVLNERPRLGLANHWIDSVSVDDFGGGQMAGELLRDVYHCRRPVVVAGPPTDPRSTARVEGFHRALPEAPALVAGRWGPDLPASLPGRLAALRPDGVFCVNDRIALVLRERYPAREAPVWVGFDNGPAAVQAVLPSIGIPWDALVRTASEVIRRRFAGDPSPGFHSVLSPVPVVR